MNGGAGRLGARYVWGLWNSNDVDVLFSTGCSGWKADVQFTCFIQRRFPSAAKSETQYSSGLLAFAKKPNKFYTFQCMRDLKSIAHKLHTWPRYFTLNPRYTYCFARRGFSRNKTDSFALPEKNSQCFASPLSKWKQFCLFAGWRWAAGGWWDESE